MFQRVWRIRHPSLLSKHSNYLTSQTGKYLLPVFSPNPCDTFLHFEFDLEPSWSIKMLILSANIFSQNWLITDKLYQCTCLQIHKTAFSVVIYFNSNFMFVKELCFYALLNSAWYSLIKRFFNCLNINVS